jgi:hypothetical protein
LIQEAKYQELRNVMESIEVVSPSEFLFHNRGKYMTSDGHYRNIRLSAEESNLYPFAKLRDILYTLLHCRRNTSTYYRATTIDQYKEQQHLTELLSEANSGYGTWDPDWEIIKIERNGEEIAVEKDDLTLWVFPHEILIPEDNAKIGKKSYIRIEKEFRELFPGFYMAIGNATNEYNRGNVVRIYWNITAAGAIPLMKNLTIELNAINIPFRFKILKNPHDFSRVDAAVLYMNKQYLRNAKNSLCKVYQIIRTHLNYPISFFSKELAPGLSLAESPPGVESFGEHRCRILAEAVYNTYKNGIRSADTRVSEIVKHYASLGIDLSRAYLNPNSLDDYDDILTGAFGKIE